MPGSFPGARRLGSGGLLAQAQAQVGQLAGRTEQHIAAGDELRVLVDEDLPRWAEVEFTGLVPEKLTVHPGPDQAPVGVDVDLGHPALGGGEVFIGVHAHRAGDLAAGGVDAVDFLLWDARAAVHDEREAGQEGLDLVEHVEMQRLPAFELEGAVGGADRAGEGIASGGLDEPLGLGRIGQAGIAFLDLDVLLDPAQHPELGLDGNVLGVGPVDDPLGDGDVLGERIVGGVDHDRAVEARIDAIVAGLLVTVVQVDRVDRRRKDLLGGQDDRLEHALVGVLARAFGDLDDEGRL